MVNGFTAGSDRIRRSVNGSSAADLVGLIPRSRAVAVDFSCSTDFNPTASDERSDMAPPLILLAAVAVAVAVPLRRRIRFVVSIAAEAAESRSRL